MSSSPVNIDPVLTPVESQDLQENADLRTSSTIYKGSKNNLSGTIVTVQVETHPKTDGDTAENENSKDRSNDESLLEEGPSDLKENARVPIDERGSPVKDPFFDSNGDDAGEIQDSNEKSLCNEEDIVDYDSQRMGLGPEKVAKETIDSPEHDNKLENSRDASHTQGQQPKQIEDSLSDSVEKSYFAMFKSSGSVKSHHEEDKERAKETSANDSKVGTKESAVSSEEIQLDNSSRQRFPVAIQPLTQQNLGRSPTGAENMDITSNKRDNSSAPPQTAVNEENTNGVQVTGKNTELLQNDHVQTGNEETEQDTTKTDKWLEGHKPDNQTHTTNDFKEENRSEPQIANGTHRHKDTHTKISRHTAGTYSKTSSRHSMATYQSTEEKNALGRLLVGPYSDSTRTTHTMATLRAGTYKNATTSSRNKVNNVKVNGYRKSTNAKTNSRIKNNQIHRKDRAQTGPANSGKSEESAQQSGKKRANKNNGAITTLGKIVIKDGAEATNIVQQKPQAEMSENVSHAEVPNKQASLQPQNTHSSATSILKTMDICPTGASVTANGNMTKKRKKPSKADTKKKTILENSEITESQSLEQEKKQRNGGNMKVSASSREPVAQLETSPRAEGALDASNIIITTTSDSTNPAQSFVDTAKTTLQQNGAAVIPPMFLNVVDETAGSKPQTSSLAGQIILQDIKKKMNSRKVSISPNSAGPVTHNNDPGSPILDLSHGGKENFGTLASRKSQNRSSLTVPNPVQWDTHIEEDSEVTTSRRESTFTLGSRKSVDYKFLDTTLVIQPTIEEKPKSVLTNDDTFIKSAIPFLPIPLAILCLFLNIVVPGSGTILSGFSILCCGQPRLSGKSDQVLITLIANFLVGLAQICTVTFLLVGWFWSVGWGIQMVSLSVQYRQELKEKRDKELKALALNAFGSPKRMH